jgi:hypothetical protein
VTPPTAQTAPAKAIGPDDLVALLRVKYPADAYAVLDQVRDGAGFNANRTGDVMVMGLWPSRGLTLEGFEIKVSRGDWIREVRDPKKAESLFQYCDRWWLLVSSADIVQDLELPEPWGLLAPKGRGLGIVKQAPRLTPDPMNRSMLAALLKRAWMRAPAAEAAQARVEAAKKEGLEHGAQRLKLAREEAASLERRLADFERVSGVRIDRWGEAPQIGEAVRAVLQNDAILRRVARVRDELRVMVDGLDRALGEQAQPVATEERSK